MARPVTIRPWILWSMVWAVHRTKDNELTIFVALAKLVPDLLDYITVFVDLFIAFHSDMFFLPHIDT
jgi:hypothetical protein